MATTNPLNQPILEGEIGTLPSGVEKEKDTEVPIVAPQQSKIRSKLMEIVEAENYSKEIDQHPKDFSSGYSLCMVCPCVDGKFTDKVAGYMDKLKQNELDVFCYHGYDSSEIYVLIRADIEVLRNYADEINYRMLLDASELQRIAAEGNPEKHIGPINISHMPEVSKYQPFEHIYGPYSRRMPESLYAHWEGDLTPFNNTVRAKLTAQLVERPPPGGGQNLKMKRYIYRAKTIKGYFPLHDPPKKEALEKAWIKYPIIPWDQPVKMISDYFGEKICLYFVFLGHYSKWSISCAVVGLPLQIAVFVMNDYSAPFLPFFSYFIALWGIMMLEFWKRKESQYAMLWGTNDFEANENDRADYTGQTIVSYINGQSMVYFSTEKRNKYVVQSTIVVVLLICVVVGMVASIYVIRFTLEPLIGTNAQTVASVVNAIQIQVANAVYSFLATALTDRENHRTETHYEDALISKIFLFQFVNSYASFFYLAFVAELFGDCPANDAGGCMSPLAINLAIIFGSRLVTGNLLELLLPWISYRFRLGAMVKSLSGDLTILTRPEAEYLLEPYDVQSSSIADFSELAIQFGYASMFVAALPMAPAFSLISNMVETTGDAWKLLHLHQRPLPNAAEDIGTWQTIFTIISVASVITNASLTVFTMTVTNSFSMFVRFWIYIGFQWSCFCAQAIIMQAIPDVPQEVEIQAERTEYLVDKVIEQVADDIELEAVEKIRDVSILVHPSKGRETFASY